jgi:hypothetical protein
MIKINYKNPEENETREDVARANIIISDKFKKGDYLEMSCISWLKLDSKRDYQDLEQLLRHLNLDSHIIAQPVKVIPENLEISFPNGNISLEPLEYAVKISCRPKEEALQELLLVHPNYEQNFECLKKTGCFMVKKTDPILEVEENLSNTKGVDQVKKVLDCELKLDFTYFKPMESIDFIINDLTKQYGKEPEKIICGEANGNKVYGLMISGQIVSPIGWMEKKIKLNHNNKRVQTESNFESELELDMENNEYSEKNKNITNITNDKIEFEYDYEYELIDFRTIKIEK